jgi:hypothetical protein
MQRRGESRADTSLAELADPTLAALQGGLLRAQARRDPDQLAPHAVWRQGLQSALPASNRCDGRNRRWTAPVSQIVPRAGDHAH